MSILIRGMEMPTSCWRCCLSQLYEKPRDMLVCKITHEEVLRYKIESNCPLVPVPAHGRLIDADAVKAVQQADADLFKGSSDYGEKCRYDEAINAVANIVNAPTIIPEEGE